ncbi:Hsp20/alpha crystallin family protein [Nitratidesulfovibrio liaohensis]|uniref:Hsp20/alpha crystallin family protein n=1 Tax=Nitratidesulfovibrio liaohensis TaxID=2604158 RepID=A0ABY9R1B3_9BACT|nr:Hsp20/alpha crystallin family protein [Nitratidesulfovibrio liaohensis]WMW64987.1 Hsp20/alpha crystallin family protein [Nitratidesulfovibrio liaohensis]
MTPPDRRPRFPHPASRPTRQNERGGVDNRARQGRFAPSPQPPRMRPQADLVEREDGFHLFLDMPGVAHDDLVLDVEGDELTVRGVTRFGDCRDMGRDEGRDGGRDGNAEPGATDGPAHAPCGCGPAGGPRVHAMEFGDVEYHAVFTLSDMVDAARIAAQLTNGVLTIRMPKREAAAPRRITVEHL